MSSVIVDTYKLKQYAQRIDSVIRRIEKLDKRLDLLCLKAGVVDLIKLVQADALIGYNWRLSRCEKYLLQTSSDFEETEQIIKKLDPENFKRPSQPKFKDAVSTRPVDEDAIIALTQEMVKGIGGKGFDILKKEISDIPSDIKSAGEILSKIEDRYKELPKDITHAFDVFVPGTLKDAYSIASGLLQGDLTYNDAWKVAKNISTKKPKIALFLETVEYTFTTASDLDKKMQSDIMKQLKEGDILGALNEAGEGFVDGVMGGSIMIMGNVGGKTVDGFIDDIPVASYINKFSEYASGMLGMNDGKGYTVGGLISKGGENIYKGIDSVTDAVTEGADKVTSAITKGAKDVADTVGKHAEKGIKWVKSFFN